MKQRWNDVVQWIPDAGQGALAPPEHAEQDYTAALPPSVLPDASASYDTGPPESGAVTSIAVSGGDVTSRLSRVATLNRYEGPGGIRGDGRGRLIHRWMVWSWFMWSIDCLVKVLA